MNVAILHQLVVYFLFIFTDPDTSCTSKPTHEKPLEAKPSKGKEPEQICRPASLTSSKLDSNFKIQTFPPRQSLTKISQILDRIPVEGPRNCLEILLNYINTISRFGKSIPCLEKTIMLSYVVPFVTDWWKVIIVHWNIEF